MKAQITFKVINPHFDKKYAQQYFGGKESSGNYKYLSGGTEEILDITTVELIRDGSFHFLTKKRDGQKLDEHFNNLTIFRFHLENGKKVDYAASKSVLRRTHQVQNKKYPVIRCYFYINEAPAGIQLSPQLYVHRLEVPKIIQPLTAV